jgi:hypothetical protein
MTDKKNWTLNVEEDPSTGDAMVVFPEDLLELAGWKEGDYLVWNDLKDGSWSLTKKEPRKIIFEYVNDETDRRAILMSTGDTYYVAMYAGLKCVKEQEIKEKTQEYAENCAENWVSKRNVRIKL